MFPTYLHDLVPQPEPPVPGRDPFRVDVVHEDGGLLVGSDGLGGGLRFGLGGLGGRGHLVAEGEAKALGGQGAAEDNLLKKRENHQSNI